MDGNTAPGISATVFSASPTIDIQQVVDYQIRANIDYLVGSLDGLRAEAKLQVLRGIKAAIELETAMVANELLASVVPDASGARVGRVSEGIDPDTGSVEPVAIQILRRECDPIIVPFVDRLEDGQFESVDYPIFGLTDQDADDAAQECLAGIHADGADGLLSRLASKHSLSVDQVSTLIYAGSVLVRRVAPADWVF